MHRVQNMSSDFASSGVDSNPSSPMPEHKGRDRNFQKDLDSSKDDYLSGDGQSSPSVKESKPKQMKNKRRRRNY